MLYKRRSNTAKFNLIFPSFENPTLSQLECIGSIKHLKITASTMHNNCYDQILFAKLTEAGTFLQLYLPPQKLLRKTTQSQENKKLSQTIYYLIEPIHVHFKYPNLDIYFMLSLPMIVYVSNDREYFNQQYAVLILSVHTFDVRSCLGYLHKTALLVNRYSTEAETMAAVNALDHALLIKPNSGLLLNHDISLIILMNSDNLFCIHTRKRFATDRILEIYVAKLS